MWCNRCTFTGFIKIGKVTDTATGDKLRLWKCKRCGNQQADPPPFVRSTPKELYFDIETAPMVSFLWSLRVPSKYINPDMIIKDWFVISWAASWMDEKEVYSGCVTAAAAKKGDDKKIMRPLWNLLDAADIVVGHNSNKFDIKKVNTRFELHGFGPPRKYRQLDTLVVAKKYFAFDSNKMDFISEKFGGIKKHDMEFDDWKQAVGGDVKTLTKMERYNKNDVVMGKRIYNRIKSWINPYPNRPRDGYKVAL